MQILEKAPAKINLSLDVLHKRPDGFHEVEMVMTTVDLADRIQLTLLHEPVVQVESESRFVPNDERNLAYRAAKLIQDRFRVRKGVHIHIEKNIPVAAGLAGEAVTQQRSCAGLTGCGISVCLWMNWPSLVLKLGRMYRFVYTEERRLPPAVVNRFNPSRRRRPAGWFFQSRPSVFQPRRSIRT